MTIDLAIGETSKIESEDKSKIDSIVAKVKELNGRLSDIRREQIFQRVRCPDIRLLIYLSLSALPLFLLFPTRC